MFSILFLCLLIQDLNIVDSKSKPCSRYYDDYSWWNYGDLGYTGTGCDMDYSFGSQLPINIPHDVSFDIPLPLDTLSGETNLCPKIEKCSQIKGVPFTDCQSTDDCRRSEVCCQNPCKDKKQCLIKTNQNIQDNFYDSILTCPTKISCPTLSLAAKEDKIKDCDGNLDCTRTEICCKHSCDDLPQQICMRGVLRYPTPFY